jgi:hypothetical protein
VSPASAGVKAFGELAKYLFGGNSEGRKMKMTSPVLSNSEGVLRFVIGPSDAQVRRAAAAPRVWPRAAWRVGMCVRVCAIEPRALCARV